jgi:ABC-2 type transport system ATP-binding protein
MKQPVISALNLRREYVTYDRGETLRETVISLFARKKVVIPAVKGISFEIGEGEIVGLLGANGAGKSTTIKMLTGVLFPTSGEIQVLGFVPFRDRKRYVSHIGAVFGQKSQLIWDIPPLDSFLLNKAIYAIPDATYRAQLNRMTDILDLGGVVRRPTRTLSLGERMKCEFVMSMLHRPQVVFLDEPTIGVDLIAKDSIHGFIREMNSEGVTFVLTTHDLEDVERLAHRVIIINHGEKVFEGGLQQLKRYLGDKKTVRVATKGALPPLDGILGPGAELLEMAGDKEAVLEVDSALLPMEDLMKLVASLGELQDISIKEMDIDKVVKAIYNE